MPEKFNPNFRNGEPTMKKTLAFVAGSILAVAIAACGGGQKQEDTTPPPDMGGMADAGPMEGDMGIEPTGMTGNPCGSVTPGTEAAGNPCGSN
jgi:hypothetical protein